MGTVYTERVHGDSFPKVRDLEGDPYIAMEILYMHVYIVMYILHDYIEIKNLMLWLIFN